MYFFEIRSSTVVATLLLRATHTIIIHERSRTIHERFRTIHGRLLNEFSGTITIKHTIERFYTIKTQNQE